MSVSGQEAGDQDGKASWAPRPPKGPTGRPTMPAPNPSGQEPRIQAEVSMDWVRGRDGALQRLGGQFEGLLRFRWARSWGDGLGGGGLGKSWSALERCVPGELRTSSGARRSPKVPHQNAVRDPPPCATSPALRLEATQSAATRRGQGLSDVGCAVTSSPSTLTRRHPASRPLYVLQISHTHTHTNTRAPLPNKHLPRPQ